MDAPIPTAAINPTLTHKVILPTTMWTPVAPSVQPPVATAVSSQTSDNGLIARRHLMTLSETIGPRLPGTEEEARAAAYIQTAFEVIGYKTRVQPFFFTTEDDVALNSANVIAVKAGLSSGEIIVGAHYDSGDEGQGADDNASGAAVMLEVAEKIKNIPTPYVIRFVALGAEENDLNGSRYYVDQMSEADIHNTIAMINLDSLIAGDITYVYGDAGPGSLRDWILKTAQDTGFKLEARTAQDMDSPDGTPCDCADYGPFLAVGIPFAYFEATNWNLGEKDGYTQVDPKFGVRGKIWHTEYDNVGYIDSTFQGRIDQHLNLFVTLLYDTLTQFQVSD